MPGWFRREFLETLLGLAVLPVLKAEVEQAIEPEAGRTRMREAMGEDIVMLHGANCGGWCFDEFRKVFEGRGWTCHTPDLVGHGKDKANAAKVSPASAWPITAGSWRTLCGRSRNPFCSAIRWER
ncbi:MAG: hypothetical protein ACREDO_02275 [Methyloceanibacter sp.]